MPAAGPHFARRPAVPGFDAAYTTALGTAYHADALHLLAEIPSDSVDLICTSPPFALLRKKAYRHQRPCAEWWAKPFGSAEIYLRFVWRSLLREKAYRHHRPCAEWWAKPFGSAEIHLRFRLRSLLRC